MPANTLRIAICQINSTVGDLGGNRRRIIEAARQAEALGADLALFPELALAGYPPEDLLLKPGFINACHAEADTLAGELPALPCLIGMPWRDAVTGNLHNTAMLYQGGKAASYYKTLLPNYAVFDEKRYFQPGERALVLEAAGAKLGVIICEDAWELDGPAQDVAAAGACSVLCLSASPFHRQKHALREETFARLCRDHHVSFVYCNLVGGQDELVFDGGSLHMDENGKVLTRGPEFREAVFCVEVPLHPVAPTTEKPRVHVDSVPLALPERASRQPFHKVENKKLDKDAEIYECLVLGVRDYVHKNGFSKAVIGLSGGIDSALTACIAVDALGRDHVTGVTLPSRYSSGETRADAAKMAVNLNIPFLTIPIEGVFKSYLAELSNVFLDNEPGLTEENLQARLRAVFLMALSNKFGWLVLNTSNKSEAAVGYGTMYGDMVGAYAVLKDVFKTTVFSLSRYANVRHGREVIPVSTITRPPSAELRDNQKDSDSIPEYEILDPILEAYIEKDMTAEEISALGHSLEVVRKAIRLTDAAEWKRRQSAPGVRITAKAFGKDRRMPLTNRYRA